MNSKTVTVGALARAFATRVQEELGAHVAEINRRNATPEYRGCCATQDYCDANMLMLDAYGIVADVAEDDIDLEQTMPVMNDAWDMAKAAGFDPARLKEVA